jgi:hypothetical protein
MKYNLTLVKTYKDNKIEQVPIVLSDDWLVSDAYLKDDSVHLRNALDGREVTVKLSELIDNPMGITYTKLSNKVISGITDMVDADYVSTTKKVNNYSNAARSNDGYVENLFCQPKEMFEAVDFTDMGVVNEEDNYVPKFVKGEKYALSGVSCEGFEMPEKIYELVGVHDEYDGININSVIVKQVGGYQDRIFTLSKHDCECMGIEYENGLQLFPKHLSWRRVKETIPFDKNNLGTTPTSDIDNTIRYVLLKLNGFKDYSDGYVVTPSGKLIKEERFVKSLRVTSDEPIVYEQPSGEFKRGLMVPANTKLDVQIVYPSGLNYNHGNFISEEDTVYILIKLVKDVNDPTAIDGKSGVERPYLDGFNPNDHFKIAWDELGAYTVEEYEAEKARKEKAKRERIEREEKERQRRIAEEEKRVREKRKLVEQAVDKMKDYNIKMPSFPKMPDIKMESGLSSLNLYMDSIDVYFDTLDSSLKTLSKDLNGMFKIMGVNLPNKDIKSVSSIFDMLKL